MHAAVPLLLLAAWAAPASAGSGLDLSIALHDARDPYPRRATFHTSVLGECVMLTVSWTEQRASAARTSLLKA